MKMLMFQTKLLLMFNYVKDFANFELLVFAKIIVLLRHIDFLCLEQVGRVK